MIITGGTLNGGVYLDQQQVVTQGLTMWLDAGNPTSYPGSGSTWFDLSGFGSNISLQNSPAWTAGTPAYFTFNAVDQYGLGSTPQVLPNNQYTKSMWLRLNDYADNNVVSSDAGGHFTYMATTNRFYSGHSNWANYNAFATTATFGLSEWYYVAVTFEAGVSMKMYVNGVLDSTSNYNLTPHPGNGSTNVASFNGGNLLKGSIGEFFCYNRPLSAAEVLQNFNATRGIYGI